MRKLVLLSISSIFFVILFSACVTDSKEQNLRKIYANCKCGPTLDAHDQPQCAIWGDLKNLNQAQAVWQSESHANCGPKECSQLFSKFCEKIQMWPHPVPSLASPPPITDCYCDQILFENENGKVQLLCAAWSGSGKNILEYYSLDECNPNRCQTPPFHSAPNICGKRFKQFYPPLLHKG